MRNLLRGLISVLGLFLVCLWNIPTHAIELKSWDNQINGQNRFKVLREFDQQAVLDRETMLVWERFPNSVFTRWVEARFACAQKTVGGRKAWRLPSLHELSSLVDPTAPGAPMLPPGHPFGNVLNELYFATTVVAQSINNVCAVSMGSGQVTTSPQEGPALAWCVRGGHPGPEAY